MDQDLEQVEVIDDLLEECWFFDNLLNRRSRVLRYCHSDPFPSCSSPSPKPEKPASGKNLEASTVRALTRTPSLPPCIERRGGEGEAVKKIGKLTRQLSERVRVQEPRPGSNYLLRKEPKVLEGSRRNRQSSTSSPAGGSLQRTQTLPSYIGRDEADEFQDQDRDSRLGFLIREALNSSSGFTTPAKTNASKVSSIPRPRPPRSSRSEERNREVIRYVNPSQKILRKTVSNLEPKEIRRLEDLVIGSKKPDSDSDSNSNSNLRDKKQQDEEQRMVKGERAAAAYAAATSPGRGRCTGDGPPIPAWVAKESSRDMKTQIKFWARAVASNVRQEC